MYTNFQPAILNIYNYFEVHTMSAGAPPPERDDEFLESVKYIQRIVDEVFEETEVVLDCEQEETVVISDATQPPPTATSNAPVAATITHPHYQPAPQAVTMAASAFPTQPDVESNPVGPVPQDDPRYRVRELKALAFDLNDRMRRYNLKPEGFGKLKHQVFVELQHLQTMDDSVCFSSSNIHYLNAIWRVILDEGSNVRSVLKKFKYLVASSQPAAPEHDAMSYAEYNSVPRRHRTADGKYKRAEVIVDVVCDDGARWIKVKASSPYAMQIQFLNCGSSHKAKNVVTVADSYLAAADQHPCRFRTPSLHMVFSQGITSDLAYILSSKGVRIHGTILQEENVLYVPEVETERDISPNQGSGGSHSGGDSRGSNSGHSRGSQGQLQIGGHCNNEGQYVEYNTNEGMKVNQDDTRSNGSHDRMSGGDMIDDQRMQGLDESTVNLGVRAMLTMISSLTNGEINQNFYDELQNSLYSKQVMMVTAMFDNSKGNSKSKKKKMTKSDLFVVPAPSRPAPSSLYPSTSDPLDFKYCDVDLDRTPMVAANGNRLTKRGFIQGYAPKFNLSDVHRRKTFSQKSYEEQKMLLQMFLDEMKEPVLPQILQHIAGKKLICCESAWNHFMEIVTLSAGHQEWNRCCELQKRITIVPDQPSERTLRLTGKAMSKINQAVFGTGDSLHVLTVSAIGSFLRRAERQGVKYHVFLHSVRPLMERFQAEYEKKQKESKSQMDGMVVEEEDAEGMIVIEEEEVVEELMVVEEDELEEDDLTELREMEALHLNDPATFEKGRYDFGNDDGW